MFYLIFAEYRFCIYFLGINSIFHTSAMFVTENYARLGFTVASSGLPQLAA